MYYEQDICSRLLELFGVAKEVKAEDIKNLEVHQSGHYACGPVYAFHYRNKHYYVVDDYSLDDNPQYVRDILAGVNHLLEGSILKNARQQADGAKYAEGLDGIEYYLWEAPSK